MANDYAERPRLAVQAPDGHLRNLSEIEADVICLAMSHYRGNVAEIARNLQIGRSTLYRKLDLLGIESSS